MGSDRIVQHDTWMIKNFLKLSRGLAMTAQPGISQATHINRIHRSNEGTRVECRTRNSEVVRSRDLCHFERFRCVALVESFECPQRRQVAELDGCVLRVALFEVHHDRVSLSGLVQNGQRKGRSVVGIAASVKRQRRGRVSFVPPPASRTVRSIPHERLPSWAARSRKPAWRDNSTARSDSRAASFRRAWYAEVRASWCWKNPWASNFA